MWCDVVKEQAVQFGETASLVGVLTEVPRDNNDKPAVILLNPGIVHRVGPGRIYVKIARALGAKGFPSLRFDLSGIGDSTVRRDSCCFDKSSIDETRAAMSFLQTAKGIDRFILLGGCSGAMVSLETARADRRVIGAILINFPARIDEEGQTDHRSDAHYYLKFAFLNLKSWRQLLTGHSDYHKISRTMLRALKRRLAGRSNVSPSDQRFRTTLHWLAGNDVQLTFICSKGDPLAGDLREAGGNELKRLCARRKVACEVIPRSDHTFSSLHDQERLVNAVIRRASAASLVRKQRVQCPEIALDSLNTLLQRRSIS
jgi:pimeloyl-ACP methyl ester carboxylesterase